MAKKMQFLAFDLGASNGRGILARFDGEKVALSEVCYFENNCGEINGTLAWDHRALCEKIQDGLRKCCAENGSIASFGIDTWAVDYGLLDKNDRLLDVTRAYRHMTNADMQKVFGEIGPEELFRRTGIARQNFNTIFQLCRRKWEQPEVMERAETMLMLPDLFAWMLTGEKGAEYTNVTTTMLYNPDTRDWDWELIRQMGLPEKIFLPITPSATRRGVLRSEIAAEMGMERVEYVSVGTHDTASAVAAVPGRGEFAFCSSGTWSLFGMESDVPVRCEEAFKSNFSNEGTVQGGYRPLVNIMGLWIIQECRRDWEKQGLRFSWGELADMAAQEVPFRSIIDPDYEAFFGVGDMEKKIRAYCRATGQPEPESVGQVARCVYDSLALKYRWALGYMEKIKGTHFESLNIVGGGSKNKLLNRLIADSIGRPVYTGPTEGAAMGNILVQAMAFGEIANIEELREVVRNSESIEEYIPDHRDIHDEAYARLLRCMETVQPGSVRW